MISSGDDRHWIFGWIFTNRQKSFTKIIFSVVSVCCRSVWLTKGGFYVAITHDTLDLTTQGLPWPYPVRPPVQEVIQSCCKLLNLDITVQGYPHAQTCSTWSSLCNHPPNLFKHVHYEAHTIDKWAVGILLECFL